MSFIKSHAWTLAMLAAAAVYLWWVGHHKPYLRWLASRDAYEHANGTAYPLPFRGWFT